MHLGLHVVPTVRHLIAAAVARVAERALDFGGGGHRAGLVFARTDTFFFSPRYFFAACIPLFALLRWVP